MNDDDNAMPGTAEEAKEAYPFSRERIGAASGANIPQIALQQRWPELIDPPAPAKGERSSPHGMVYVPPGLPDGVSLAGQCQSCLSWYVWPVESADGVSLLQCVGCYALYRPYGD
jgi:hypothetical protein